MTSSIDQLLSENFNVQKKVAIIGGGISGLTLAYFLNKFHKNFSLTIFEKEKDIGGKIQKLILGNETKSFGPKTVVMKEGSILSLLIEELGLKNEVMTPSKLAKNRYIFANGKLISLPKHLIGFLKKPFFSILKRLIKEPFIPPKLDDETISEFFKRRFGQELVDWIIDPLCKGIYGGGCEILSIKSTFGFLKELETQHGSVIKGMFSLKKSKRTIISFKNGLCDLVDRLKFNIHAIFKTDQKIIKIEEISDKIYLHTQDFVEEFDHVFLALDPFNFTKLFPNYEKILGNGAWASITQVYLEFMTDDTPYDGFGVLVPSKENDLTLGILFDSVIFPNRDSKGKLALTVMIEGVNKESHEYEKMALESIKKILKLSIMPINSQVMKYPSGIFLPAVKHQEQVELLFEKFRGQYKKISLLGAGLKGVSVADQIENAYAVSKNFSTN